MSTVSDKEWHGMCKALSRQDLIDDERFATALARRQHASVRREVVGEEIARHSTDELLSLLDAHDVPCAPLLDRLEILEHPQIVASETIVREVMEDYGEVRQARPAARFDRTASSLRMPAPKLGEHSREILRTLGYGDGSCDDLIARGVVRQS
jgi:crotonobetainyl-CoA:carnitine CoA-transferase CaiB-like acyl-CoA transferase